MKSLLLLLLVATLAACSVTPISEDGDHISIEIRGHGSVWADADRMAEGYCEQRGKIAGPRTTHDPGFFDPGHWYVEYDCVRGTPPSKPQD